MNTALAVALPTLTRIHEVVIGNINTRFYMPPNGEPEMCWMSLWDIAQQFSKAAFPRIIAPFQARLDRFEIVGRDDRFKIVAVPHWLAVEILQSAKRMGHCDAGLLTDFGAEAKAALNKAAGLQPSIDRGVAYRLAAKQRLHQQRGN